MNALRRPASVLGLFMMLVVVVAGCGSQDPKGGDKEIGPGDRIPASDADASDIEMSHVHGIGRNPADGDVYVASHHGLWLVGSGPEPKLVGRHQHDFMGFAVVGPDHFVASGHPDQATNLPPHLGLIESKDAGETWTSRSLLGEADFHSLHVTGGATYGWNSQNAALVVSENGSQWNTLSEGVMMLDFAVDPGQATTVLASVPKSQTELELQRSKDEGRSFTAVAQAPPLARFVWTEPTSLFGFAVDGSVYMSDDAGESWAKVGSLKALPDAVSGSSNELLAAVAGEVLTSGNRGRTWQQL